MAADEEDEEGEIDLPLLMRDFGIAFRRALGGRTKVAFIADLDVDIMHTFLGRQTAFERIVTALRYLAPTKMHVDPSFLNVCEWSRQVGPFPSVSELSISGAAKDEFFDQTLPQALAYVEKMFPNVGAITIPNLALRLGQLGQNLQQTVSTSTRQLVTMIHQAYLLDPMAGIPTRPNPRVFIPLHLAEAFPNLLHFGYVALYPTMWNELETHSPEALANLASLRSICIFMETEPERFYGGAAGIRAITDGFARHTPKLETISFVLELRSRNYPTLGDPDEWSLIDSVYGWETFIRKAFCDSQEASKEGRHGYNTEIVRKATGADGEGVGQGVPEFVEGGQRKERQTARQEMTSRLFAMADLAQRTISETDVKKRSGSSKELMQACKWLFDYAGRRLDPKLLGPVPTLVIDSGMDVETIWEQVQLRNQGVQKWLQERVAEEIGDIDVAADEDEDEEDEEDEKNAGELEDEGLEGLGENEVEGEAGLDEDQEDGSELDEEFHTEDEEEDGSGEEEENDESQLADPDESGSDAEDSNRPVQSAAASKLSSNSNAVVTGLKSTGRDTSIVADKFFRLEAMEKFAEEFEERDVRRAERANRAITRGKKGKAEEEESDESEDGMSEEDDEENEDEEEGYGDYRFEDFFDPPPNPVSVPPALPPTSNSSGINLSFADRAAAMRSRSSEEVEDQDYEFDLDRPAPKTKKGRGKHSLDEDGENEDEVLSVEDDDDRPGSSGLANKVTDLFASTEDYTATASLSTNERAQLKLRQKTEALEKELTSEKHWALTGEVTARSRPVNSLLEEVLDFDHASRPVPMVTDESGRTLEEMIKRRIRDGAFDDVQRRVDERAAMEARGAFDPNKIPELSEEKSKKSLAEEYESEFVKQKTLQQGGTITTAKDEQLTKQHKEIDDLFTVLTRDLDALSAWHYTPTPPKPVLEVLPSADTPAIAMEEATPAHVSNATAVAPEEVYKGPRRAAEMKAREETDAAERTRERKRQKKMMKLNKKQKAEEDKALKVGNGARKATDEKKSALKSLVGKKGVVVLGADGKEKGNKKGKPGKGLSKLGTVPASVNAGSKKRKVELDIGDGAKRQRNFKL
ncbi:U3 snoRNP protein [Gonapodya sp. JEL0774]|nr:U3 snoRNP protein [Gonapodya sp. JEL0774]